MQEKYTRSNIEINMLIKLSQDGDKRARNELIKSLLYLVPAIAVNYNDGTCDINDLIQSGYEGLIKGVDNYNLSSPVSFKECLNYYINNEIKACYDDIKAEPVLTNINECQNTPANISIEEDYLKKAKLEKIYSYINDGNLTEKQLCAFNEYFGLDLPNAKKLRLSRKSKYQHKEAAIDKIKKIIIK